MSATKSKEVVELATRLSALLREDDGASLRDDEAVRNALRSLQAACGAAEEQQHEAGSALVLSSASVGGGSLGVLEEWRSESHAFYDEMLDERGEPRSHYAALLAAMGGVEVQRIESFPEASLKAFRGDNALYHIPRLLTPEEHSLVMRGVRQRAEMWRLFLNEQLGDSRDRAKQKALNQVLPRPVVEGALRRAGEKHALKTLSRFDGFWFGPDILRGPDGAFYVCEDNAGYVGGLGDLLCARSTLLSAFPEIGPFVQPQDPMEFYRAMAKQYRELCLPEQVVVTLFYPRFLTADNEERRLNRILRDVGIIPIPLPVGGERRQRRSNKRLEFDELGAWLVRKNGKRQSVGVVVVDGEPFDVDPKNRAVRNRMIEDEATYWHEWLTEQAAKSAKRKKGRPRKHLQRQLEELDSILRNPAGFQRTRALRQFLQRYRRRDLKESLSQGFPGLFDAQKKKHIRVVNGYGFDFLGDKAMCAYADNLIRHYLKEEPILKTIPTLSFAKLGRRSEHDTAAKGKKQGGKRRATLDAQLLHDVFELPSAQQHVVIKRVDGRGGDGVWVGPKISREDFVAVREQVAAEPEAYLVQKYLPLSQLDGHLVDLRVLCSVTESSVEVAQVGWGRMVPAEGSNGKVNISDRGFECTIAVAKE